MPLISVIVPVYRAQELLRTCTDSILGQSLRDLELILVEDGSPDESGALCDAIAQEDPRVRVIHKPNGGVSSARNEGLKIATGEYIAFCDADDTFELHGLETMYNALIEAGADSAGCGHWTLWPDGRRQAESGAFPTGVYEQEDLREHIVVPLLGQRLDLGQGVFNGFSVRFLYSRSLIEEKNIRFEGPYLEDELFLMEYFLHAKRLAMVDEPLYNYFQNPASVTKNYLPDYPGVFRRFMERKQALVRQYGLEELCPGWEENSCWAGLLIAVGNEYAPGNSKSLGEKTKAVKALCGEKDMAHAIEVLHPKGLTGNKQLVANLVMGRHFWLLTILYTIKNGRR